MADFRMPSLGADMDAGTLTEWLVAPGEPVHRGDVVAVVDTDKSAIEIESFDDGVMGAQVVQPGQRVPVGTVLATIAPAGASTADAATAPPPPAAAAAPPPQPSPQPAGPSRPTASGVRASPMARRLAAEARLDLAAVTGTGTGGAVTARDVRDVLAQPPATPHPAPDAAHAPDAVDTMRRTIAAAMSRSKREIPHYYLTTTIDLSAALGWMHERNRERPVTDRLVPAALLLAAAARAARAVPQLNGTWSEEAFHPSATVDLGLVVSLRGGGILVPTLGDAAALRVDQVMARMRDLVARARAGRLRSSHLATPSITVTDLGDQGVDSVLGVIYPPQVALVGFGTVAERPWAVDGLLGIRPTVVATLAADHRASDGAIGARLLRRIDTLLQTPEEL